MPFLSLTSLHEQLLSLDEKAYEERRTRKIPDRAERFFEARFRTQRCRGDQVLEKLNQTLDMFEPRRAPHQVIFHRHFIRSCLPKIYGADWDQMAPTVLARMGLREIKQETLVVTPRRYGKTVAVAMFCAAMIYCVSDLEIGIFSTGKRAAAKLMAKTWQLFMQLPGAKGMIKSKNAETAIVHDIENVGDERTMSSYPASTKVSQGGGGFASRLVGWFQKGASPFCAKDYRYASRASQSYHTGARGHCALPPLSQPNGRWQRRHQQYHCQLRRQQRSLLCRERRDLVLLVQREARRPAVQL